MNDDFNANNASVPNFEQLPKRQEPVLNGSGSSFESHVSFSNHTTINQTRDTSDTSEYYRTTNNHPQSPPNNYRTAAGSDYAVNYVNRQTPPQMTDNYSSGSVYQGSAQTDSQNGQQSNPSFDYASIRQGSAQTDSQYSQQSNPSFDYAPIRQGSAQTDSQYSQQPNPSFDYASIRQGSAQTASQYSQPQGASYPPPHQQYYGQQFAYGTVGGYMPQYSYRPSPKKIVRDAFEKDASLAGKTTIILLGVMIIVSIVVELIALYCGVSRDVPTDGDPYMGFTATGFYLYEGLVSLLSIFVPSLIIMKASRNKISELVPFKRVEGKKLAAIVFCGMSLCMVAQLMSALIGINFSLIGIDIYKGTDTETATGIFDLVMNSICTAVIPALVEEFAYRGLVLGVLKKHDSMFAVFGSAFLFGMLHGNFAQIPFAFVVGLVLGYVRVKTDSMLPCILIHFGNNFYAVIVTHVTEVLPESIGGMIDAALMILLFVVGFIAMGYLLRNEKDFFSTEKSDSLLTFGEMTKSFISRVSVIACMVILTLMSVAIYSMPE